MTRRTTTSKAKVNATGPGLIEPLTVITVIALCDHDVNRPLAPGSVVPGHLLCAANVFDVQFELLAWLQLSEWVYGYRRFATAAEAIRFAVEDFPAIRALNAWLQVGDERFDSEDIHRLYLKDDYPLRRRGPMSASGPTSGRMRRSKASKNKMA
jgi:hypothetical protein